MFGVMFGVELAQSLPLSSDWCGIVPEPPLGVIFGVMFSVMFGVMFGVEY